MFMAGCASTPPPTEQLAVANAAVANASSAGGGDLAAGELQTARDKLDRAKVAIAAKDYDQARPLLQEAQVDAQLAEARARSLTSRKAVGQLQEGIQVLREELDRKSK